MTRKGNVFLYNEFVGVIEESESGGYVFTYDKNYLNRTEKPKPISLTLPIQEESYYSKTLFPFFDGLIPEGWLLDLNIKHWKYNPSDRMGLLLECCRDCIGAVHVEK